jgi:polysaccharide pyruvyl transferase WcaK-like protein
VSARIAFVSPCGGGNLGDAAIVDSLIHGVRARLPGAEILGFTGNPDDTAVRHGVTAFHMRAPFGGRAKSVAEAAAPGEASEAAAHAGTAEEDAESAAPRRRSLVRRVLRSVPGARASWQTAVHFAADNRHYRTVAGQLRGCDLVIISGGGQFDELFGGPFKHPYALWRFGGMARDVGARFAILSVGTGTLTSPGRLFVRRALALADYASFRDMRSRELVGEGTERALVVPDLAYALPLGAEPPAVPPPSPSARSVVGLSPMAYADPRFWPQADLAQYRRHVASLARMTVDLVRAGHQVVLFTTDGPDRLAVEELRAEVLPALRPDERALLRAPEVSGVPALLDILSGVHVVISARFHGVLLAHVMGRPTLAVAHERKVATLMDDMGHKRFCWPIDAFDPTRAWQRFLELDEGRATLAADIRARAAEYRGRVENQYDRVLTAPARARAS